MRVPGAVQPRAERRDAALLGDARRRDDRGAPALPNDQAQARPRRARRHGRTGRNNFFVEGRYTVADIALYAYTHVADEGGFDLAAYPAVRAWLSRVAAQPGHIPIIQA